MMKLKYSWIILILIIVSCSLLYMNRDINDISQWIKLPQRADRFTYEGMESDREITRKYGLVDGEYYNIEILRYIDLVYTSNSGSEVVVIDEIKSVQIEQLSLDSILYDSTYYMILNYDSNYLLLSADTCDYFNEWGYDRIIVDCPMKIGHEWAPFFRYSSLYENEITNIAYESSSLVLHILGEYFGYFEEYYEFDLSRGIFITDSLSDMYYKLVENDY